MCWWEGERCERWDVSVGRERVVKLNVSVGGRVVKGKNVCGGKGCER